MLIATIQGVASTQRQLQLTLMEIDIMGQSIPVSGSSSVQSVRLNNDRVPTAKASGTTLEYYPPNKSHKYNQG